MKIMGEGVTSTEGELMPTGAVIMFGSATPPIGYLVCDGSSQLIATYPALSAVIRPQYGGVDGTHFNLPNFASAFPRGNTPASNGGAPTHSHGTGTLAAPGHTHTGPSHSHTGPSHNHTMKNHTHALNSHTHTMKNHTHLMTVHTHSLDDSGFAYMNWPAAAGQMPWRRITGITGGPNANVNTTTNMQALAGVSTPQLTMGAALGGLTNLSNGAIASAAPNDNTSDASNVASAAPNDNVSDLSGTGVTGDSGTGLTSGASLTALTGAIADGANLPPYIGVAFIIKT